MVSSYDFSILSVKRIIQRCSENFCSLIAISFHLQNRLSAIPGLISTLRIPGIRHDRGMEGVTNNGSTYPSWTGPRADWRAILSSLINARVMDSVGFKPACSCWRHNRQDTTTLATLDTTTMLQLATLFLCLRGLSHWFFFYYSSWINLRYLSMQHSQKRISHRIGVLVKS